MKFTLSNLVGITFPDIIHRPIFNLNYNVSETVIYLHFQVEPTRLRKIELVSVSLNTRNNTTWTNKTNTI
jgi:hypothetical protein